MNYNKDFIFNHKIIFNSKFFWNRTQYNVPNIVMYLHIVDFFFIINK